MNKKKRKKLDDLLVSMQETQDRIQRSVDRSIVEQERIRMGAQRARAMFNEGLAILKKLREKGG